ncbi:MAG: aminotransferase class V-fold PLP-dependent enzyme [Gemmatimonadetes bacterium]|nr:aminotransferase class V-fold PLP-dependent enzyme [Gemmatimonadota bacterium]NNM04014.1 aminotransferase class V-fold PLP-dependent enzyme [Gemmatimonadota bacterium]
MSLSPRESRVEFPILRTHTYLNSCSLGALSHRAEMYLDEFLGLWHTMGASAWYEHWMDKLAVLRGQVEAFLGGPRGSLALVPSTSAALSTVAESVQLKGDRNRVICSELDFPTLGYQWAVKPDVEVVVLPSNDGIGMDPDQFAEAVDERTLFLATSHVFFTTGFVQDLRTIADIAHAAGAYCLIDGYQGAGQIPLSVAETGVDFYTTGPLKWLCGGPGLSYLFVRPEIIPELYPRITGWFGAANAFDFDIREFRPHGDARRFEMGTPALHTVHTALGGQEIIDEVGIEAIARRNRELTNFLVEGCADAGFSLTTPSDPTRRSAIVMIKHPDPPGAVAHLANSGIIVDHRPGHVRVSPHFYNNEEEIAFLLGSLKGFPG